ncbi:MAG: YheC/YheD family protein [Thermaerobacterales bacterium]
MGPQTISYKSLQRAARDLGMHMMVFMPDGVRPAHASVAGYWWSVRRRRWIRRRFPHPDVVLNRVPRRETEALPAVQRTLTFLQRAQIPLFNPRFLDKWEVHKILSADPLSVRYVPPARLVNGVREVLAALEEWQAVYVKPVAGSLGRGVIYVERGSRGYRYYTSSGRRHRRGKRRDARGLALMLKRMMRKRCYIAQKAIERVRYEGRPVDIRALVQRDHQGQWVLTGMAARVAGIGRLVTHVPQGGSRMSFDRALSGGFAPDQRVGLKHVIADAAVRAGEALELGTGDIFGELSLDLALDLNGAVWILECNAKPFRFDEPVIRGTASRRLVRFARYLARARDSHHAERRLPHRLN